MILVFDLDDTLYEEITYVQSGFRAVAAMLSERYRLEEQPLISRMMEILEQEGRGRVFDILLSEQGLLSRAEVKHCLSAYRLHHPRISLSKAGSQCLARFRHLHKYIVTDGNKIVQDKKVKALGLHEQVNGVYVTHMYGIRHAKPSPYCFEHIAKREKVNPDNILYVADNPRKDFVGIRPLGFQTLRVHTGMFSTEVAKAPEFDAEFHIDSLDELTEDLLKKIFR